MMRNNWCAFPGDIWYVRRGSSWPVSLEVYLHYIEVIMTTRASQITSLTVVYSTVYSDADQSKHQSSASLAFVWGIHRDRWIPRTKGQLCGKCFHFMTSSCPLNILTITRGSIKLYSVWGHKWCCTLYAKIVLSMCYSEIIIFVETRAMPSPLGSTHWGRQNCHFSDDIFKYTFLNENMY